MSWERIPNRVSMIIPVYNRARFIKPCLDSLVQQSYKDLELIIIDDGSTDQTFKVIQRWKRSLKISKKNKSRILVVRLPRNMGVAGATHTALFLAKGEYMAMQDSDDVSHPDRIAKQVEHLQQHPHIGMVGTNYVAFENEDPNMQESSNWLAFDEEEITKNYSEGRHCLCHGTLLFRGSVFDQVGGHTRHMKGAEDYDFIARCIAKGICAHNLPDVLYYYRSHPLQRSRIYY